ncbi:MAG: ABC transporter substrate-binding protein [Cyanobacteria bacterium P01_D01_bin.115]
MKRRNLFKQLAFGATGASLATACSNQQVFTLDESGGNVSSPSIEWRMATSWPENLEIRFGAVQQICNRVSELTQGRFSITAFPAGGIAPPLEILDTVQSGTAECGHTFGDFYTAKNPAFAFASSVPFGLNPQQQMAWLYGAGGLELIRKLYADFGVVNFPAGSTGNQMGGWFRERINSLSELQALRMRIVGLGGEVLKRLDIETQTLPPNEILLALERGDIDAAEWVCPYEDENLGLNQYARYYYYPGWQGPGSTYDLMVNQSAYERLPEDYRKVLEIAAFEAQVTMLARYEVANEEALQRLISGGTELVVYSEEILQAARTAANDLYAEYASQDAAFREIYDNWNAFRQRMYRWSDINDKSFANLIARS